MQSLLRSADSDGNGLLDRQEFISFFGVRHAEGGGELRRTMTMEHVYLPRDAPAGCSASSSSLASLKALQTTWRQSYCAEATAAAGGDAAASTVVDEREVERVEMSWHRSRYGSRSSSGGTK